MTQTVFNPAQCARIAAAYNAPDRPSLRDLGERYHADHHVIAKAIRDAGGTVRPKRVASYHIAAIEHDWNSDIPSSRICRVYGIPNTAHLSSLIAQWRGRGWQFKYKRLTQSEEITAGAIRQACRRCHGKGYIVVERNGEEGEIRCEACGGYGEARNEHC